MLLSPLICCCFSSFFSSSSAEKIVIIEALIVKGHVLLLEKVRSSVTSDSKKAETVVQRCSVKKVFVKISQNSQENTCARVSYLMKLQAVAGLRPATLLKKRLWHRCFPVNFAKSLTTPIFIEHL